MCLRPNVDYNGSEKLPQTSVLGWPLQSHRVSQVVLVVKNPPVNVGNIRDADSIPGSGRYPGGGHGNPLLYSCLGESHGQRRLGGYSPQGCNELDMTEVTQHAQTQYTLIGFIEKASTHSLGEDSRNISEMEKDAIVKYPGDFCFTKD